MMTTVIKQYKNNNYYITLEIKNRYDIAVYVVQVLPCFDKSRCGYPISEISYPIKDRKKALATYRRYIKKYGMEE